MPVDQRKFDHFTPEGREQIIAVENEIFRVQTGSEVYGTSIGGSDQDQMGVAVEPKEYVMGLSRFDQLAFRTAEQGAKSGPGDLDLTIYSLRKYARLCAEGNPSIILGLHTPPEFVIGLTTVGRALFAERDLFLSRRMGARFLGYLDAQRKKALGQWAHGDTTQRPQLVEQFGFDTKFAMHMVRLGVMGEELMRTGKVTMPMSEQWQEDLQALRRGERTLDWALGMAAQYEFLIKQRIEGVDCPLPKRPDPYHLNGLLIRLHEMHWER